MASKDTIHVFAEQKFCPDSIHLFNLPAFETVVVQTSYPCDLRLCSFGRTERKCRQHFARYLSPPLCHSSVLLSSPLIVFRSREVAKPAVIGERYEICKITVLDDHSIFVPEGVAGSANGFDAGAIAVEKFSQAGGKVLDDVAKQWAAEMVERIGAAYPNNRYGIDDLAARSAGVIANGVFITQTDVIYAVRAALTHRTPRTIDFGFFVQPISYGSPISAGHFQFAWSALAEAQKHWGADTPDDWAAAAEFVVARVRDSSIDPYVGGDIATIILERGKSLRWYHQPIGCAQNRR